MKHFILRTDHKPLKWLATVSDAHGRRGRWVDMLQDFSFKIVHRPGLKHMNVDALSRNPVGSVADDDGFGEELQDVVGPEANVPKGGREFLCAQTGEETEWMGIRRRDKRLVQHNACCFSINHWRYVNSHQLYMIDAASEEDPSEELLPDEEAVSTSEESMQNEVARVVSRRRRPRYFDKRQQLELVLAAQELSELGDPELSPIALTYGKI